MVGVGVAVATAHAWGRALPRWLVIGPVSALAALMILRALLQAVGDVQRLGVGVSDVSARTARWDLALWSPYFLVWGVSWGAVAYVFARATAVPTAPGPSDVTATTDPSD